MQDYNTKERVIAAVTSVALANTPHITSFAVQDDSTGYLVTFENQQRGYSRQVHVHISTEQLEHGAMTSAALERLLDTRLQTLVRR